MHHSYAESGCVVRAVDFDDVPIFQNLAFFGLIQSEKNGHKRGFARAILAQKRMNFASFELQRYVVVCNDSRELLGDMAHFDDVFALRIVLRAFIAVFVPYGVRNFFRLPDFIGFGGFHFGGADQEENIFGGRGRARRSREGEDVLAKVDVTFEEAALGADKVISFRSPDGSQQSLKVHIPAGIDSGQKIRLRGKGMPGQNGGQAGNMLLEVTVQSKPGFERKGTDLYTTVEIPFETAVLGGEAIVPTLTGKVSCKIKEGTQSGTKIRLKGKGIVSMKNPSRKGDEYAVIQIHVPKNLTPAAKQKLTEYAKAAS